MRGRSAAAAMVLVALASSRADSANPKNHIEGVRRKAPVVYLGMVRDVKESRRGRLNLTARATLDVLKVFRAPAARRPAEAFVTYASWDDTTPPMAGGPQYRLRPGTVVLVFAGSFDSGGVLLEHGSKAEVSSRVETLSRAAARFSAAQLEFNEITEDDRRVQLELYDAVAAYLRSSE